MKGFLVGLFAGGLLFLLIKLNLDIKLHSILCYSVGIVGTIFVTYKGEK